MVKIRQYESKDQEQVLQLIESIMKEEFRGDETAFPLDDIHNIKKSYGTDGDIFFVAENHHHIVGIAAVKREDDRVALLRRVFVAKDYRMKKVGSSLIQQALQFCSDRGYGEVVFRATSRMKGAIRLCEKSGFVKRAAIGVGPMELSKWALHLPGGWKKTQR